MYRKTIGEIVSRFTSVSTKITLVLLLALSVLVEGVILPAAATEALSSVGYGQRFMPLIVIWGALCLLCGQIMVLIIWHLVSLAGDERIFTNKPLRHVRLLATMPFVAAGLFLAAFAVLNVVGLTPPVIMYGLIGAIGLAVAVGLILITMRSLLLRAISLSTEMDQVV